jgi:hypothetical protein
MSMFYWGAFPNHNVSSENRRFSWMVIMAGLQSSLPTVNVSKSLYSTLLPSIMFTSLTEE